jgi:hypothetical protein
MGFLDDVRRAKDAADAQPPGLSRKERMKAAKAELADEKMRKTAEELSLDFGDLHIEIFERRAADTGEGVISNEKREQHMLSWMTTYIREIDLSPEDTYGVLPLRLREGFPPKIGLVHRDTPAYAKARESYHGSGSMGEET